MLWANIDAADRIDESAELMTAAEIAPNPIVDTNGCVRCCKTRGKIWLPSLSSYVIVLRYIKYVNSAWENYHEH